MTMSMARRDLIRSVAAVGVTVGISVLGGPGSGTGSDSGPPAPVDPQDEPGPPPQDGRDGEQPADEAPDADDSATNAVLRQGDSGEAVLTVQGRLGELGYWCGTPDGTFGSLTTQAVLALQKVAGLTRDGLCGPATRSRLDAGTRPRASTSSGHVIEIHRDSQVLLVVDSGRVGTILATCTGSEHPYEWGGRTWSARTTPGSFHVYRRRTGWYHGPLGDLYRPMFFNGGIAVHGSRSVPPYPASHGCCRLTVPAMDMLLAKGLISIGTAVVVY